MHNTIKKLADMISNNNLEQIERQLRVAALSLRNANQTHLHTEIENDKKILLLAHEFLTRYGKPDENWRTSQTFFEQLTDLLEQTRNIENHLQLSMISWCCQLEQTLKNSIDPNHLISLGSAYYAEPHKFMGFLYWLLENNAAPTLIIQSNILHRFFAYHSYELVTVKKSYALLANLSDNTSRMLSFLEKKSCGMRGFINNENDGTRYSYNLLGSFFSHEEELPIQNLRETHSVFFESICLEYAEQLFYLFGWELIKKLNYSHGINLQLLQNLLRSQTKTKILSELPFNVLNGQLPMEFTNRILSIIKTTYSLPELLEITLSEPFYIHAVGPDLHASLFEPHLKNIINMLCDNEKYNTLSHLPFLATLTYKLANDTPTNLYGANWNDHLFGTNWNTPEINLILKKIVEIILPYGNSIHDTAIQPIHYIFSRLRPFFLEKIVEFSRNIDTAILNFNYGEIDYDTLTQVWGNQLSAYNLILSLLPNLIHEIAYPHSIYQLHIQVLQKKCALCIINDELLPLENMLSVMTPDSTTQKRILQEALIHPSSQAALIETILNYRTSSFSLDSLIFEPFGMTKSVLFHACSTEANNLQIVLFKKIPLENHIMAIIENLLFEDRMAEFNIAWSRLEFDETNSVEMIRILLSYFQNKTVNAEIRFICFSKLFFLLNKPEEIKLPDGMLTAVLAETIKYEEVAFTKRLCNLNGANQLTSSDIESALFNDAILHETWETTGLLCGLSGDDTVNPTLVPANNIDLFFKVIEKYKTHYNTEYAPTEGLKYKNSKNESILYFAANHCTFKKLKKIFNEIQKTFASEPYEIYLLLNAETVSNQMVACTSDHPHQKEINDFLNGARDEYEKYEDGLASTIDDEEQDEPEEDETPTTRNHFFPTLPINRRRSRSTDDEQEQDGTSNGTQP